VHRTTATKPPTPADLMAQALCQAERAQRRGEVPVGAVIVAGGEVLARACNETIRAHDPTAHAEVLALRRAARRLGTHRLVGAEVYVTLEPCAMCMGAMIQARIASLTFACRDAKAGAAVSLYRLGEDHRLNHRFTIREGVLETPCRAVLQQFFRARRSERRALRNPASRALVRRRRSTARSTAGRSTSHPRG
jgi:tRNA(Arg) A34 adenosine deaminase TadA